MKTISIILIIAGGSLALYSLTMDTSVAVNYPNGNSFGFPDRVNNMGLMNDKQNYLMFSGVLLVIGTILFFIDNKKIKQEDVEANFKTCPRCIEKVRIEAKICRYCNFDFSQGDGPLNEFKTTSKTVAELYQQKAKP